MSGVSGTPELGKSNLPRRIQSTCAHWLLSISWASQTSYMHYFFCIPPSFFYWANIIYNVSFKHHFIRKNYSNLWLFEKIGTMVIYTLKIVIHTLCGYLLFILLASLNISRIETVSSFSTRHPPAPDKW